MKKYEYNSEITFSTIEQLQIRLHEVLHGLIKNSDGIHGFGITMNFKINNLL